MTKRVTLLGKGSLAIRIAQWFANSPNHDLAVVVPVVPEPTWTDSLTAWCKANGTAVVESGDVNDLPIGQDRSEQLCISVFYDRILKQPFIESFAKCINVHNGPLPRYRGVSPINWALKNGESMHGTTIHEITPGVDDGPIIAQVTYSIYPEIDEVEDVYRRSLEFGWKLFEQTIDRIDVIRPVPQDDSAAIHYRKSDDHLLGDRQGFRRDVLP